MLVPLVALATPTARAAPNCDVTTGRFGVAAVPAVLGVCALALYDTNTVQWASPGEHVCV